MNLVKVIIRIIKRLIHDELYSDPKLAVKLYRKKGVKIGDHTELYNTSIDSLRPFLVSIGNNVLITGSKILTHDASTKKFLGYTKVGKVSIGNNVFIGVNCIVLPGVSIGNNIIIGAGTIISKDVPDNSVVVGNPMKVIGKLENNININRDLVNIKPIFNQDYKMSSIEIERMVAELKDDIGYVRCND